MSDHVTQSEQSADFAPYTSPPPHEDKTLAAGISATDPTGAGSAQRCETSAPGPKAGSSAGQRRGPEDAASNSTPVSRTGEALDDAVALANLLMAPLDPVEALGQVLVVGMRLLPEARALTVCAVDTAGAHAGSLLQLAAVERREAAEPPVLDLERRVGVSLGLAEEAQRALLRERLPIEQGDVAALPLRMVSPDAPAASGLLLVRWETPSVRGTSTQKALALLVPACSVLLDRREQSLAHDAFLSLTVHELRSPLTAVKGYAQLLLRQARRLAVPPQTQQAIDAIEEQATRMADMISEMHDAVRIRRGDLELHPERHDIRPLVEAAVQQQRRLYPQHTITFESPDEPLFAEVDPQRLTQVVAALVNNAARYSPNGGPVVVRLSCSVATTQADEQRTAMVCVQDAGIGVAATDRVPIFEYLYRAPEATRRHLSGLGLGLFVSRSLVERMGGQLWLDQARSSAEGAPGVQSQGSVGSIFCFTLPLTSGE